MYLVLRDTNPIAVYDRIEDLVKDIERRIAVDYTTFERSSVFGKDPFDLDVYLDLTILICKKNLMNWVESDFELNQIYLYDFLNDENSSIVKEIEKYNTNFFLTDTEQE